MRVVRLLVAAIIVILAAGGASLSWGQIALLDSQNTKDFFGRHYTQCDPPNSYTLGADEYQRYFRGWQWVLTQLGKPYTIINDGDITAKGLAGYKLLILSNNAALSDDQSKAVQKWVISGGRLLATFGTGYKDIVSDPRQIDGLKTQEGGTTGLHQLWHDPAGKLFSSYWIDPGVDVTVTRFEGPTLGLESVPPYGAVIPYGAEANLLINRPINYPDALGYVGIDDPDWKSTSPAIISARQAKGLVVYFAFAPEYIVYKELEMPNSPLGPIPGDWPTCWDKQDWTGRSYKLRSLMSNALLYLLSN